MSVFDVAARAGVSIATVSRVLNNSRRVNPEIAAQVKKAAEELKYTPQRVRSKTNKPERELKGGTIAVVSVGQESSGWFEVPVIAGSISAFSRIATQNGLSLTITEMPEPDEVSPALKRKDVVGAIAFVSGALHEKALTKLAQTIPTVRVLGGQFAPPEIDHVTVNNNAIGYLAAQHLLEQGCRKLAFLTVAPSWYFLRLRAHGFAVGAAEMTSGTHPEHSGPRTIIEIDPADGGTGADFNKVPKLIDILLASGCDGVFVPRDEETVAVYRELNRRGIVVGKDIKVVSCDNDAVRLSILDPRPPSIDLGVREIAHNAYRRLSWRIRHPHAPAVRILVTPRLIAHDDAT